MSAGLRVLVLVVLMIGAAVSTSAGEPSVATRVSEESYSSFLDSLRTRSDTVSREGVRSEWQVADSLTARIIDEGPSRVGTPADTRPLRRVYTDFVPALSTFNRVEGLRLGGEGRFGLGRATLNAGVGYGFSNKEWRHREELSLDAGRYGEFRGGYSDLIEAYGAAPNPGNAFYAFVGGADDQDYLLRRAAAVRWRLGDEKRFIGAGYEVADERSVVAATDWNLFGRDRDRVPIRRSPRGAGAGSRSRAGSRGWCRRSAERSSGSVGKPRSRATVWAETSSTTATASSSRVTGTRSRAMTFGSCWQSAGPAISAAAIFAPAAR